MNESILAGAGALFVGLHYIRTHRNPLRSASRVLLWLSIAVEEIPAAVRAAAVTWKQRVSARWQKHKRIE